MSDISAIDSEQECRLIDVGSYPVKDVLDILLQDRTSNKNIVWATDAYRIHGDHCSETSQITDKALLTGFKVDLVPRIEKNAGAQQERTKKNGEVFTPVWLCNHMNNYRDEEWFGRKDVFNRENEDGSWEVTQGRISFPDGKTWKDYVESRVLEITCGEAPFLTSRYDAASGDLILPPYRRIGILDRKLRVVNENASGEEEWDEWVEKAFQSCYGFEFQGDSLLIARINMLVTFCDYFTERWGNAPVRSVLRGIAEIIAWNVWQMDGLKDTLPYGSEYQEQHQTTLLGFEDEASLPKIDQDVALPCRIMNWRDGRNYTFRKLKRGTMRKKMFDFVIGNPPYQETTDSESTRMPPVYNLFMDEAYKISDIVELITPARFLFNAGYTPKVWNEKILNDPHFKVLFYEPDCTKVFHNTDIKGGIVISYRDENKNYGPT